jgi:hypothetical protein
MLSSVTFTTALDLRRLDTNPEILWFLVDPLRLPRQICNLVIWPLTPPPRGGGSARRLQLWNQTNFRSHYNRISISGREKNTRNAPAHRIIPLKSHILPEKRVTTHWKPLAHRLPPAQGCSDYQKSTLFDIWCNQCAHGILIWFDWFEKYPTLQDQVKPDFWNCTNLTSIHIHIVSILHIIIYKL